MFSLLVYYSIITEVIIATVGAVIQIPAEGTCETLGEICIVSGRLEAECYRITETKLQEMNYNHASCTSDSEQLCLQTTVQLAMNNTLYTVMCSTQHCGIDSAFLVGATSMLIVAGK